MSHDDTITQTFSATAFAGQVVLVTGGAQGIGLSIRPLPTTFLSGGWESHRISPQVWSFSPRPPQAILPGKP